MNFPIGLIAVKSLWNRRVTSLLTIASIALSVALLLGVEKIRIGARDSFSNTISQTDLIVGARGGTIQLLLYSVFRVGTATNNISFKTYETLAKHPAVAWTIPLSLGDSHQGYRVVATNENFYEHYRYMGDRRVEIQPGGSVPKDVLDVALGSEVAKVLKYKLGDSIILSHGIGEGAGIVKHGDKPFKVVAILNSTGTPVDRSVYITLEGMEAIHMDWTDGAPPVAGKGLTPDQLRSRKIEIGQITSFLLRTKSRIETLRLQREINTYENEALTAIIPGVALSELWSNIGYAEAGLQAVSALVVVIGLFGMLIALYSSLNERRREMAILRAIGAHVRTIGGLLILEAIVLTLVGALLGIGAMYGIVAAAQPLIREFLGLTVPMGFLSGTEAMYVGVLLIAGILISLVPAWRAYRNALVDGLSIRV